MKKISKRILSFICCLALIVTSTMSSLVIASASAVTKPGANLEYTFDSATGTMTISGTGDMYDFRDTNLLQNHMTPWSSIKSQIKTLIVEEGVTGIGEYSFYNCTALTSVSLPSTLKEIRGSGQTGGANSESNLVSYGAFRGCTALTEINLPDGLETIGNVAFRECTALKSINIPDSVTSLGTGSFVHCTSLVTVTFGSGVTEVPTECFYECSALLNINWGENIATVGPWAFYGTRLNSVDIPESVTTISARGFADCYFLGTAIIRNRECSIANYAFDNSGISSSTKSLTIKGYNGSTAQTYATDNSYTFVSLEDCAHTNTHTEITKAATCTDDGTQSLICDDCGVTISTSTIDALGHDYVTESTEDLTEVNGHIIQHQKCSRCGDEKQVATHKEAEDSGTVNKKYVWIEGYYTYTTTATCTTAGYETYTCTVDGCTNSLGRATTQVNYVQSAGHTVSEWNITKEATCTEAGLKTGYCTVCDQAVTEEIPATGHSYDTSNPTRTEDKTETDGHIYKYYTCTKCNEEQVEIEHTAWVDGCYTPTIVSAAGCVVDGIERDTCDICSESRTVTIEAVGSHDWVETSVVEPTCTSTGHTNYTCSRCNLTKQDNQTEALGHDYVLVPDSCVAATCTVEGTNIYKCSRCSAQKTEAVPAAGHTPVEGTYVVTKEATCETDGSAKGTCSVCGQDYTVTLEALGHDFVDVETEIEDKPGHVMVTPTCQREGCNTTDTSSVKHVTWVEGYYTHTVITEATCITGEISTDTCTICNEVKTNNEGDPLGHGYTFVMVKTKSVVSGTTDSSTGSSITDAISGSSIGESISGSSIGDAISGIDTSSLKIPNYSVVYRCTYCQDITYKTGEELMKMWDRYFYNGATYGRSGNNNSCYLDVNGDSFINAKDYAQIYNLNKLYLADQAAQSTES